MTAFHVTDEVTDHSHCLTLSVFRSLTHANDVSFPSGARDFSPWTLHTGRGAHPVYYSAETGESILGIKLPGLEADHSPPPFAESKIE